MHDYDEFDEERDLKAIKAEPDKTESGDRMSKSDMWSGILFFSCIAGVFFCACVRGCQEIKKHTHKENPSPAHTMRISPHNCR